MLHILHYAYTQTYTPHTQAHTQSNKHMLQHVTLCYNMCTQTYTHKHTDTYTDTHTFRTPDIKSQNALLQLILHFITGHVKYLLESIDSNRATTSYTLRGQDYNP